MSDTLTIKRMLADRAADVAEHLLPGGHKEGHEWRAGSTAGEAGKSLGVHLSGPKAGVWSDFATGEGGDLLDLWCKAKGLTLAQALDEARAWLGVTRPALHRPVQRQYVRPAKPQCTTPKGRALDYLKEDRNLPTASTDAYRIGETATGDIVFPFLLPDGTLALVKTRKPEDGARSKPTAADCELVLFGWQVISENAREVTICEGEIDALSLHAYGFPALSVPIGGGGGNKQRWIESEFERLERFEKIYLATDMDDEGEKAAAEIANRLGRHRCLRVRLPRKDANECLVDGVPRDEVERAFAEAHSLDPEGLRRASEYADNVVSLFWPQEGQHLGYRTPYGKLGTNLVFRPAEVTVWTGDAGAGKSQIISDCLADWIQQGARVCLSSLEMKPAQTLKRLCKQVVGADRPTEGAIRAALHWLDRGLLLYELTGKAKADALLDVFSYARAKYGCDTFIIDSLMRLGIAGDDYNSQEAAIFRLVDWTIANGVHIHLVAHSRKGDRERGAPETQDIKGAMEIGANAFNIVSVWRNRQLEEALRETTDEAERATLAAKPGVILNVAKQRNGDFEGKIGLWFDQATYRYRSAHDDATWTRRYLPEDWQTEAAA
jgi:twinkle protein